jgi:hypothetical protein
VRFLPSNGAALKALQLGYSAWIFVVVSCLWLFFKLQTFDHALLYIKTILYGQTQSAFQAYQYAAVAFYAIPVLLAHLVPKRISEKDDLLMAVCYGVMLTLSIFDKGPTDAFIYFQF